MSTSTRRILSVRRRVVVQLESLSDLPRPWKSCSFPFMPLYRDIDIYIEALLEIHSHFRETLEIAPFLLWKDSLFFGIKTTHVDVEVQVQGTFKDGKNIVDEIHRLLILSAILRDYHVHSEETNEKEEVTNITYIFFGFKKNNCSEERKE